MTSFARIACVLVLAAGVAHAQTPPQNKTEGDAAYADGQKAYAAKDYKSAAAHFMIAFAKDPDPIYLFNAAQAYRLDGDCRSAYDAYKQFYALVKDKQVSGIEKVQEYIDEEAKCAQDATQPPKQPEQIPIVTQQQPPPPPSAPTEPAQPMPQPNEPHDSAPSKLPEISLLAGGGVLLAIGIYSTAEVISIHGDAQSASDNNCASVKPGQTYVRRPHRPAQQERPRLAGPRGRCLLVRWRARRRRRDLAVPPARQVERAHGDGDADARRRRGHRALALLAAEQPRELDRRCRVELVVAARRSAACPGASA